MKTICRVFSIIIFLPLLAYSQVQNRIIDWHPRTLQGIFVKGTDGKPIPSNIEALEIIEIKVDAKPILLGHPFSASDDWLKNLIVRVRNISGKPISSIRMYFNLPEAKYREGTMGFSLEYGKALSTGINYGVQKTIMSNEELDLFRNEAHYNRDREGIAQRAGITDFSKVLIGMTMVQFEDGTVWSSGKLPFANQSN
jgi:hypothetical protein